MIPFERTAIGAAAASFTDLERELLTDLATQVIELLGEPPDSEFAGIGGGGALSTDPAIARLLPDAYRDDAEASREFRRFTENSLAARKVANARALIGALAESGEIELGADTQQAWLRALTDIRLIIASRLGIENDDDPHYGDEAIGVRDADLMMRDIYDWLGMVQGSLIEAIE